MSAERIANLIAACDEAMRLAAAAVEEHLRHADSTGREEGDLLARLVREAEGEVDVAIDRVALALERALERMRGDVAVRARVLDEIERAIDRAKAEARAVVVRLDVAIARLADWSARTGDERLLAEARERIESYAAEVAAIEAELAEYHSLVDDLERVRAQIHARTSRVP